MKKILFLLGLITGIICNAQTLSAFTKTVFIDNIDSVCNNFVVNFPVRVKNFNNIVGILGTIKWDSTVLKFDSLLLNTNTSIIKFYDTTTNLKVADGTLTFLWTDSNFIGVSIPDSAILFTVRLKVINPVNYVTPIYFSSSPTQLEIVAQDSTFISYVATDTAWNNGYIKFVDTPKIIQNGNIFTCISSCTPLKFVWNIYDSAGQLIQSDTTTTNNYTFTNPFNNNIITVIVYYANGNRIGSIKTPIKTLPLKLIAFEAVNNKPNIVNLSWQTANEVNISHINIQRAISSNFNNLQDRDFINISKVDAGKNRYNFKDVLPTTQKQTTIFYRLEIIDKDGSKTYSEVKKVVIYNEKSAINIYPNPSVTEVYIDCLNAKEIMITDYLGKIYFNKKIYYNQQSKINVRGFGKGIYLVKVLMITGETKTEKLLVE